jgi:hypothetical protein
MQEKSIINALLRIRVETVQAGQDAYHVNALLLSRGYDPANHHVPRKGPADRFKQAELKCLILDALRGGPKVGKEIAAYVVAQRPHISPEDAYDRVYCGLARMKRGRIVTRYNNLWRISYLYPSGVFGKGESSPNLRSK